MNAIFAVGERLSAKLGTGLASTTAFLQVYNVTSRTPFQFMKDNSIGTRVCQGTQRLVKCTDDAPVDNPRLIVHELGHSLRHSRSYANVENPYTSLGNATITSDSGIHVTGLNNGIWERTFRGYQSNREPDVYHGEYVPGWNTPNEDFADMFMNWVYGRESFAPDSAGTNRYNWMDQHMLGWITSE